MSKTPRRVCFARGRPPSLARLPRKYYLVDSRYPMNKGFLAPFKGERYHLPNFQQRQTPQNLEEKFNYLHSSLRSVIERTFGVWKNRWGILRNMPSYDICIQERIIIATMVLHNFIRAHEDNDLGQGLFRGGTCQSSEGGYYDEMTYVISSLVEPKMKVIRNNITTSICGMPLS